MGLLKTVSALSLVLSLAVAPASVYAQSQASKTGSGGVAAGQQTEGGILGLTAGAVAAGIAVAVAIGVAVAAASSDDDDEPVTTTGTTPGATN